MSFPRYESDKDSGVEWLGDIDADEKLSALPRVLSWTHYCNRHLSPTLVAEYKTKMIPKSVLQQKLHEWSQMLQAPGSEDEGDEA